MVTRFPLAQHEDERGWFMELVRASALPKAIKQANLSRSRRGVIRGISGRYTSCSSSWSRRRWSPWWPRSGTTW